VSTRRQELGRWGEDLAADWLVRHGCEILDRNVRTPYGEIDLVARQGDLLLFVEVKTRTNRTFGLPEESVTSRKQAHMLAAAEYYASQLAAESWQIDVIAIEGKPGEKGDIVRFENVLG
jgi:putative endonuclease